MKSFKVPKQNMGSLMAAKKPTKIDPTSKPVDFYSWESPPDNRPAFTINARDFNEVKDWQVGCCYKLEVEVEITRSEAMQTKDGSVIVATARINTIKSEPHEEE